MRDNWNRLKLDKLGRHYSGLTNKSKDNFGKGKPYIPYLNIFSNGKIDKNNLELVEIFPSESQNKVKKGDLFFTTSSETPHEVGMTSVLVDDLGEAYLNSFCFGFRLDDFETLLPEFAVYLFRGKEIRKTIADLAQGSTRYNLSKSIFFDKVYLNLPPLPQQQKIAKILSTVDNVIEKTESAIAKYQAIKQGLMHDLFELPTYEFWNFYELGDIANIIDPHPSHRAPSIDDRGIPFVGIGDIDESGNLIKNARKVSEKIFEEHKLRYKLSNKTIGFGRVATIGKIIRFKNYDFKFTVSPTMAIINPTKIESDYLSFALDSNYMKTQIDKLLTGSTRSSLGIELLRKLIVKVPVVDDEKIKISKTLNSIVQKIDLEKQVLVKYQQLKAGLLQDLLTGRVEVRV